MMTKVALIVWIVMLCLAASTVLGDANQVEFRLIFLPAETGKGNVESLAGGSEPFNAHKLPYLADRDIEKIEIFRSANVRGRLIASFIFNENGRKRLYRLTKVHGSGQIGIFMRGTLMITAPVLPPMFLGEKVVVRWPGTEAELRELAAMVNHKPSSDVLALYIEEQGRYNDIAADSWADTYTAIGRYLEAKNRQGRVSQSLAEEARE